ncbi:hypothetical protein KIW84_020540 [Lathyrus oleraceus]|uniref:Uncharacterized protein n=1 Tax=Pisum sativum TaxID=3888 RepID=A0A9D5B810_PEA|nr:hypothetical protein KIW84_020540 [Pisum sativum]
MSSSILVRASSSVPPKVQKNAPRSKTYIALKHDVPVDGGTQKIKYNLLFKISDRRSVQAETSFGLYTDKYEIVTGNRTLEEDGNATPAKKFKNKGMSTQSPINSIFKKNLREEACLEIASFFYNNDMAFNVAKSVEFQKTLEMVSRHGLGFKSPSYHEIRTKYLKHKMEEKKKVIEKHKLIWEKT